MRQLGVSPVEQAHARSRHRFRQKLGFGRDKNKDVMVTQTASIDRSDDLQLLEITKFQAADCRVNRAP